MSFVTNVSSTTKTRLGKKLIILPMRRLRRLRRQQIIEQASKSSKTGRFPAQKERKCECDDLYFRTTIDRLRKSSTNFVDSMVYEECRMLKSIGRNSIDDDERIRTHDMTRTETADDDNNDNNNNNNNNNRKFLYATLKNENLYNLYAMELHAIVIDSDSLEQIQVGLFLANDVDSTKVDLECACGIRVKLEPIFCERAWEKFSKRLRETCDKFGEIERYDDDTIVSNGESSYDCRYPPIALIHETVARFRDRCDSDELIQFCSKTIEKMSPNGFKKYGTRANFSGDPRDLELIRAKETVLRFVILETYNGYAFCLAAYAPEIESNYKHISTSAKIWSEKPENYCGGTRFEVARSLMNTVVASTITNSKTRFFDPFCGSGTLCVAAKQINRFGGGVFGSDAKINLIEKSQRNARWFFAQTNDNTCGALPLFEQKNAFLLEPACDDDADNTVICSNLPFGRNVDFVLPNDVVENSTKFNDEYSLLENILKVLKPLAKAHAFISGIPIADMMSKCGYENVSSIALDRRGTMFITISSNSRSTSESFHKISDENVWFTIDEALRFDEIRKSKRAMVNKIDDIGAIELAKSNANALKIIIDLSYEHDSTRALRSCAKQLCEITSIAKKSKGDLRVTFSSFDDEIKYESDTFFNAQMWTKHVECVRESTEELLLNDDDNNNNANSMIIYLSPDAETALDITDLENPSNTFIIGGIVDLKTRGLKTSKSKALSMCASTNISIRKLPIKEICPDQTHAVLNIDAVVRIISRAKRDNSFFEALAFELPTRQSIERPKRLKRRTVSILEN
jgi:SAM-dependent methyltransferase